ncbi:hypothetical protein AB205_0178570, partial [Aquarana catesbeiana]
FLEPDLLPPPENVFIHSTNLIHILHWKPLPKSWGNVTYSVQSQGEYERVYKNHTWNDIYQCQSISEHQCNVTYDVAANVLYAFRVRSEQEVQRTSVWAEMEKLFNRMTYWRKLYILMEAPKLRAGRSFTAMNGSTRFCNL